MIDCGGGTRSATAGTNEEGRTEEGGDRRYAMRMSKFRNNKCSGEGIRVGDGQQDQCEAPGAAHRNFTGQLQRQGCELTALGLQAEATSLHCSA